MQASPTRFTRLKIILGYAVLLALLLIALRYIYQEMKNLEAIDNQQILDSDSLQALIHEKDRNMIAFFHEINPQEGLYVSEKELANLLKKQQPEIERKVVVSRHDSIITTAPKKSFFRRVADVFSPKEDSTLQIHSQTETTIDSTYSSHAADSLKQNIQKNIALQKSQNRHLQKKRERIRQNEKQLNERIDRILTEYETKIAEQANAFHRKQAALRSQSIHTIATIAVTALLLSALFLIIIGRDLSRDKRHRIQLEEARRKAEELLHAREQMMLTITHDFKAPLGNIMGYSDLLQKKLTSKAQKEEMNRIQSSARHLMELIKSLLDFHRLERKKTEPTPTAFCPATFFREIAADYAPTLCRKGLALHTDFSGLSEEIYETDTTLLRQIIDNLLSNALKFTEQGSITLSADIQDEALHFAVADTGSGIDESDRERIFQAFTRLPGAQGQEGFGLGLSIVHELILLLEGEIHIESEKGAGTTFRISLPISRSTASDTSPAHTSNCSHPDPSPKLSGLRFLLIDDDRLQLQLTQTLLQAEGAEVTACLTLPELLDSLRHASYDFLLTDVQMPAMNGFDLLQLLRSSNLPGGKDLPIIAVTARDMPEEEFTSHGFIGCLQKPFSRHDLLQAISAASHPEKRESIFDWNSLTEYSDEDENGSHEILRVFYHSLRQDLEELQTAVRQENIAQIAYLAHRQLPVFTLIRAEDCVRHMQYLEKQEAPFSDRHRQESLALIAEEEKVFRELQTKLQQ